MWRFLITSTQQMPTNTITAVAMRPDDHLGFAGGVRMPFAVEVHREERGGGVELGAERRHERDDHAAGDHAAKAVGQNLRDERGVGGVTAGAETDAGRLGQRKGDHARHQEDEHRRQLEEAGEDGAAPGFLLVFAGEHALDDVLVGAPIPEADDGRAGQNRQPGPVGIVDGADEMDIVADGRERGMPAVNQTAVAQDAQPHVKDADGTKDQHRRLKHGGIHDHAHAAEDGVKAGGEGQSQGDGPEDVNLMPEIDQCDPRSTTCG